MANFSVKFSYTLNEIVYYKSAMVRATTPDSAKDKVVDFCLSRIDGKICSFAFESISVSTYNFILI